MKNCRVLIESKNIEEMLGKDFFEKIPLRFLKKDEICFPETPRVLILKKGKLKISLVEDEKEVILYFLSNNNFCFCNDNIMVSAKEDSEFYFLESHCFDSHFNNINFCNLLLNSINKTVSLEREIIKSLAFKHSSKRISEFLYESAESIGVQTGSGLELDMKCTMEETAAFLGISRQSLSMFINDLIDKNIIEKIGYKKILIKNIEELKEFFE